MCKAVNTYWLYVQGSWEYEWVIGIPDPTEMLLVVPEEGEVRKGRFREERR